MLKVKCIMMQKNEEDLLEPWFKYHGYLFGYESLEVIDNGSTNPKVISILKKFETVGCRIHWQYHLPKDFEKKGEIIGNIIKWLDINSDYDLAIPLDCDEFVCLLSGSRITTKRNDLYLYLDSIKQSKKPFLVTNGLQNIPGKAGWFKLKNIPKGFFARNTIEHLDQGFHHPKSRIEEGNFYTNIAYVHLHNRSFEKMKKYSAEKLKLRVDVTNIANLRNYNGPGEHLVKYFLITENDYINQCEGNISIHFQEILNIFRILNIDIDRTFGGYEVGSKDMAINTCCILRSNDFKGDDSKVFTFDIASYSARNPDVEYTAALYHYIEFGFKEGRSAS